MFECDDYKGCGRCEKCTGVSMRDFLTEENMKPENIKWFGPSDPEYYEDDLEAIAKLIKDRERLNWLIESEGYLELNCDPDPNLEGYGVFGTLRIPYGKVPIRKTPREAIDAAMKEQQNGL